MIVTYIKCCNKYFFQFAMTCIVVVVIVSCYNYNDSELYVICVG